MVYLAIMVVIAGAGIGRLWWIQRRHVTSLSSVDGFRSSLERLSEQQSPSATRRSPASYDDGASAPTGGTISVGEAPWFSGTSNKDVPPSSDGNTSTRSSSASSTPRGASFSGSRGRTASDPYLEPLNPERRAAAKRRLEARRRGAARSDLRSR